MSSTSIAEFIIAGDPLVSHLDEASVSSVLSMSRFTTSSLALGAHRAPLERRRAAAITVQSAMRRSMATKEKLFRIRKAYCGMGGPVAWAGQWHGRATGSKSRAGWFLSQNKWIAAWMFDRCGARDTGHPTPPLEPVPVHAFVRYPVKHGASFGERISRRSSSSTGSSGSR